jgi:hypothetical protein
MPTILKPVKDISKQTALEAAISQLKSDEAADDATVAALETLVKAIPPAPDITGKADKTELPPVQHDLNNATSVKLSPIAGTAAYLENVTNGGYTLSGADASTGYWAQITNVTDVDRYLSIDGFTAVYANGAKTDLDPDTFLGYRIHPNKTFLLQVLAKDGGKWLKLTEITDVDQPIDLSWVATHDQLVTVDQNTNKRLNGLESDRVNTQQFSDEVTARINADTAIGVIVNDEVAARIAGDTALRDAIALIAPSLPPQILDVDRELLDSDFDDLEWIQCNQVIQDYSSWTLKTQVYLRVGRRVIQPMFPDTVEPLPPATHNTAVETSPGNFENRMPGGTAIRYSSPKTATSPDDLVTFVAGRFSHFQWILVDAAGARVGSYGSNKAVLQASFTGQTVSYTLPNPAGVVAIRVILTRAADGVEETYDVPV